MNHYKTIRTNVYLFSSLIALMICILVCFNATAGVVVGATRVVFDGSSKEASLSVKNPDTDRPYLIQSWIETNQNTEGRFIITPPLFRLDPGKENLLRIIKANEYPSDKESVDWISIKSIPSTDKNAKNELQISVRTRIKLFYRPKGLNSEDAQKAYEKISARISENKLVIENPTPYFISFFDILVDGVKIKEPGMVYPKNKLDLTLPKSSSMNSHKVIKIRAINDFGGITKQREISLD